MITGGLQLSSLHVQKQHADCVYGTMSICKIMSFLLNDINGTGCSCSDYDD